MGNTPVIVEYDFLELLKAARACVNKPHYHVGIFTFFTGDSDRIAHEAHDVICEDFDERVMIDRVRIGAAEKIITFKNGSYIKFVRASDNARGNKFHHILYRPDINNEAMHTIVRPTQIRYMEEQNGASG